MKTFSKLFVIALFAVAISLHAAPPSEQSVEQLLEISHAGKLMDSVFNQMDAMMKTSMKEVTKGQPLTPEEQAIIDKQQAKTMAIIKDELNWDKMKDSFVKIYRDTFTQEEIDGLIAFYKSPVGQSFLSKQPQLMQNTMTMMQQHMAPMMQKIRQSTEETAKEMAALREKEKK